MHYNYSFRFKSLKKACIWRTEQSPENCIYIYIGIPMVYLRISIFTVLHLSSSILTPLQNTSKHCIHTILRMANGCG